MKLIKLNENQYNEIADIVKLTEYRFYNNIRKFINDILRDPVGAKVPLTLEMNGFTRNELLRELIKLGILVKKQKIVDKDLDGNPKKAVMSVRYEISKDDYREKLDIVYKDLVLNKKNKLMDECDGSVPSGTTSAASSGQVVGQPLFGSVVKQRNKSVTNDFQFDTPLTFFVKKNREQ